jgi:hypothetical protein
MAVLAPGSGTGASEGEKPSREALPAHLCKPQLRRWEASEYLRLVHGVERKPDTLAKLSSIGGGPKFRIFGRVPVYTPDELDSWVAQRLGPLQASTSDPGCRFDARSGSSEPSTTQNSPKAKTTQPLNDR